MAKKKTKMTNEQRQDYFRKYYKRYVKKNKDKADFGAKESLKVRLKAVVPKNDYDRSLNNPLRYRMMHRFNYLTLPGVYDMPLEYCYTDRGMAVWASEILGSGRFMVCTGRLHKHSKRVVWNWVVEFDCYEDDDKIHVTVLRSHKSRLRHYWFRKKDKT